MYLSCTTTTPVIFVSINRFDFPGPSARSVIYLRLLACHVLNPMRYFNRISTVFARPRLPCSHSPGFTSRPLSSFEGEHLRLPVTHYVPRFNWRLRILSPKPPLSIFRKVLEKRAQPPLPTDSHPYNVHIQKYKDQSVMHCIPSLPTRYSLSPQFPPSLII